MAQKPDFPALLGPGIHNLTLAELREITVSPFPSDAKRTELFSRLSAWLKQFAGLGLTGAAWVDGSFLTEKPSPGDIDLVVWNVAATRPLSISEQQLVASLFDHDSVKVIYGLDLYHMQEQPPELFHKQAYWKGLLGFCHDRVTAKGFVEVTI